MKHKYLSLEDIKKMLKGYKPDRVLPTFSNKQILDFCYSKGFRFPQHHQWREEDGTKCSAWELDMPGCRIMTGDGGMKLINEHFTKEFEKHLVVK